MMEVARLTWSQQRRSLPAWALSVAALSALTMAIYPEFADTYTDLIESLSGNWQAAFGCPAEMDTLACFLSVEFVSYMPLLVSIFAVLHGSRALAGEQEQGTLDVLLAQPHGRIRVLGGKTLALGLDVLLLCVAASLGLMAGALLAGVEAASMAGLFLLGLDMLPAALLVLALALLGSALASTRGAAAVPATAYLVLAYILDLFAPIVAAFDAIDVLSVFTLMGRSDPYGLHVDALYWVYAVAAAVVVWVAAAWRFDAKDMT